MPRGPCLEYRLNANAARLGSNLDEVEGLSSYIQHAAVCHVGSAGLILHTMEQMLPIRGALIGLAFLIFTVAN